MSEHAEATCPQCRQEECDCSPEVQAAATQRAERGQEPLVIASDVVQQARRKKNSDKAEQLVRDDLNWLLRHPQGRRFMWRLLDQCGIFNNAAVRCGFDTNQTMFNAGEQNIGLAYFSETMRQEPDGYNLMVKENSATSRSNPA